MRDWSIVVPAISSALALFVVAWVFRLGSLQLGTMLLTYAASAIVLGMAAWVLFALIARRSLGSLTPRAAADPSTPAEHKGFDPVRFAEVSAETIALWQHYESIAMHFNDLIMRWRLQAIGGLAALVTASGFVVSGAADLSVRYRSMFLLSVTLLLAWVGVACIDLMYYRKLLHGAVDALLRLERKVPDIQLSTLIERHAYTGSRWTPIAFYGAGILPLVLLAVWAAYNLLFLVPRAAVPVP